jgi:hypothetical protein
MGRACRITLIALAAVFLLPPASSLAGRKMEIAVQDDAVFVDKAYYDVPRAFGNAAELNVSWIRANVRWDSVVPNRRSRRRPRRITYDLSRYDELVTTAASRGVRVQFALTGPAPAWAAGNRRLGPYKPNARLFRRFASAVAQHFKGRVRRYSIWNEPNHVGWLAPLRKQAKLYRSLYRAGYSAIKRADRGADVLFGETAPYPRGNNSQSPLRFVRAVTCTNKRYRRARRCPRIFADGFAHHPYDFLHSPRYRFRGKDNVTIGTLGRLTKALSKLRRARRLSTRRGGNLPIYLTEYGYLYSGSRKISDRRRARYLKVAFNIARKNRLVRQMLQYLLIEPGRSQRFFDTSIIKRNGFRTRSFRSLARWACGNGRARRIAVPTPPRPPGMTRSFRNRCGVLSFR